MSPLEYSSRSCMKKSDDNSPTNFASPGSRRFTILGGGVPHGSQNPDPISDQNI